MAGDPHRIIELPGVYQQVRLACPEFDVLGLAFPGVPGVQHFGHTGSAAWGITNAIAHHVEVFRERLSDDGLSALGPDGWHLWPGTPRRSTCTAERVEVDVVETERGPVVVDGSQRALPRPGRPPTSGSRPAAAAAGPHRRRRRRRPCAAGSTRSTGS